MSTSENVQKVNKNMFSPIYCVLLWIFPVLYYSGTCAGDNQPYLTLYTPGDPEYTDVLVKRVGDNLTLVCELKGDPNPRIYVWNYVPSDNNTDGERVLTTEPRGPALGSRLMADQLTVADSGHYVCSSPPYSVAKFILVQTRGPKQCARGAFWCGKHCVLASYVCDGFRDCARGEDEAPSLCMQQPCGRADKLNCSSGRCISVAACCRARSAALCRQPACCDEHPAYSRRDGYVEIDYPPLFEDRHAPDEYSFIQSTIYTVTACALIFMIAVVLLVSAICKMHMKRAALRSYTHAARHHYTQRYAQQTHRFPPCYEASRLLEQERNAAISPSHSPHASPARTPLQCSDECPPADGAGAGAGAGGAATAGGDPAPRAFPLAALSAIFTHRYRQIPQQCMDVELSDVRSSSLNTSPTRNVSRLDHYRSPTYCDLNADYFFNPEISNCGRELNYMSTPVEFYRRRTLRNNIDRVIERINRPRPLTLQLGRFQLSIPRLGRRQSLDRRPDTPNVAELNIDDLDFVRLNSNDTYTLNGRTIRLLGANFENYPNEEGNTRPPPYTEAVRYKLYGPPPEYLSRDGLNSESSNTEAQARSNVEMPPCYEDLASGVDRNSAVTVAIESNGNESESNIVTQSNASEGNTVTQSNSSQSNASEGNTVTQSNSSQSNAAQRVVTQSNDGGVTQDDTGNGNVQGNASTNNNTRSNSLQNVTSPSDVVGRIITQNDVTQSNVTQSNVTHENLSAVIDNLPAIDSDVNANEAGVRYSLECNGNNNAC